MALKLVRRSSFGWGASAAGYGACRNGLVVHYDGNNQGLASKPHSACVKYWKGTRVFHMGPSRKWADIGYSFGVCPHGYAFEGRGWQKQQAAQPGGNSTWTSVTFMSGDAEAPTAAQLQAFRDLRAYLRGKGLGSKIKGHCNFISTSCPGGKLYGMVTNTKSALYTGAASASKPAKPNYWKVTVKTPKTITIPWATPYLRRGSKGKRVGWLQECLVALGAKIKVDEDFGPATESALKSFQGKHKDERGKALDKDGIYGHHSARALAMALGIKKEDVT